MLPGLPPQPRPLAQKTADPLPEFLASTCPHQQDYPYRPRFTCASTWEGSPRATWEQVSWPPRIRLAFTFPEGHPRNRYAQARSVLLSPLRHGKECHIRQIRSTTVPGTQASASQIRTLDRFLTPADGEG